MGSLPDLVGDLVHRPARGIEALARGDAEQKRDALAAIAPLGQLRGISKKAYLAAFPHRTALRGA